MSPASRKAVEAQLKTAQPLGHVRQVTYLLALLAVMDGQRCAQGAVIFRVPEKTVTAWVRGFGCDGLQGVPHNKSPGRPPQLPPTQQAALATVLDEGPVQAGCSGACGRSPLIEPLSFERCGVSYNVFYMAQWRQNCGVSSQKAAGVSAQLAAGKRHAWRTTPWPQMLRLAKAQNALLLCGDAASLPPGGPRTSTWARRGQPPLVKTSGKRQGAKAFGLCDYCSGRVFFQGPAGRLTAAASLAFLTRVLAHTTQPLVLMQEGAKSHTSAATQAVFAPQTARLQVFQLPTYAPDYNPIEKLWKKSKQQATPLHAFPTFVVLTEQVEQALLPCAHAPEEVLTLCSLPTALAQAA